VGKPDAFQRAGVRVRELLENYQRPPIDEHCQDTLIALVEELAREAGMDALPEILRK
jgi:trimethylamine:corrinoid methyltransferase-like protein